MLSFLSPMTADAAAEHGHEFSGTRNAAESPATLQAPRSVLNAMLSIVTTPKLPTFGFGTSTPTNEDEPTHFKPLELIKEVSHEPEQFRPHSAGNDESVTSKPTIKSPRSKTTFNFAHPPPSVKPRQKLNVRPKVLLQMHKVTPGAHARPNFEVVPAMRYAPRIVRKYGCVFKAMEKLGPDDVVVTHANSYGQTAEHSSADDDHYAAGEPVAVISTVKRDLCQGPLATEICMDDGTVWSATPLANGSYEFRTIDSHGLELKARWVLKAPNKRASVQFTGLRSTPIPAERRFRFSTIRANTRRHPVIANMSASRIEVLDEYGLPDTVAAPESTGGKRRSSGNESRADSMDPLLQTSEQLRKFIIVSGIWVGFRENWSAAFQYSTTISAASSPIEGPTARPLASRTLSYTSFDLPSGATTPDETVGTLPKARCSLGLLRHTSTSSTTPRSPVLSSTGIPAPRRTSSPAATFLRRSSTKRYSSSLYQQDESIEATSNDHASIAESKSSFSSIDTSKRRHTMNPQLLAQLGVEAVGAEDKSGMKRKGSVRWMKGLFKREVH